jgi:hypothetical protein
MESTEDQTPISDLTPAQTERESIPIVGLFHRLPLKHKHNFWETRVEIGAQDHVMIGRDGRKQHIRIPGYDELTYCEIPIARETIEDGHTICVELLNTNGLSPEAQKVFKEGQEKLLAQIEKFKPHFPQNKAA